MSPQLKLMINTPESIFPDELEATLDVSLLAGGGERIEPRLRDLDGVGRAGAEGCVGRVGWESAVDLRNHLESRAEW